MVFTEKATAKIQAQITGTTNTMTIAGTNATETDPENAATQINKLLDVVGKSVTTSGMVKIVEQEAVTNG